MSGIRLGNLEDMGAIVDIGLELLESSDYSGIKPDKLKFRKLVGSMMLSKRGRVWVVVDDNDVPQGFLLGMTDEYSFSRACFATDIYTYVRSMYAQYVRALYNKFITWAKTKPRVVFIEMAQSSGVGDHQRWCALMEILGFVKNGSFYVMRV